MLLITDTATVSSKATDAATAFATDKEFTSAGAGLCIGLSLYLSLPSERPIEPVQRTCFQWPLHAYVHNYGIGCY